VVIGSGVPPGWPPPGLAERLADLEAGRLSTSPLSPLELAVVADLLALGTVQLARDAIRRQLHLPVDAMAGAQALHEWARDLLAQHGTSAEASRHAAERQHPSGSGR
jgi:hypothetical protein